MFQMAQASQNPCGLFNDIKINRIAEEAREMIKKINPTLEKHEKIEKAVIMSEEWTVENGLMTPTLKLKRSQVEKIHMPMYKSWFDAEDKVIFE